MSKRYPDANYTESVFGCASRKNKSLYIDLFAVSPRFGHAWFFLRIFPERIFPKAAPGILLLKEGVCGWRCAMEYL